MVKLFKELLKDHVKYTYPIGIDIDGQDIYALQLRQARHGLAIRSLAHGRFEGETAQALENGEGLISELKEMARNRGFRGKRVVVHLPSPHTYTFPINFRVGDEETTEEAILRESEKHLPFPIEEATIDYPSLGPSSSGEAKRFKATVIAVQTRKIKEFLLLLEKAGLTVEAVDTDISSLMRVHHYLHKAQPSPIMLCYIGYAQSLLSIVTKDSILVHRSIPWGTQILLTRLEKNLEVSKPQSRVLLQEYGLLHEQVEHPNGCKTSEDNSKEGVVQAVFQIITPYLEALIHGFHKVIGYVISEGPDTSVQQIFVYGQANHIRYLDRYLERTLSIPTKLVNPMTELAPPKDGVLWDMSDGAQFGLALGLAMRRVTWL
jgi:type IV pilus assembly protein PilM